MLDAAKKVKEVTKEEEGPPDNYASTM